MSTQLTLGSLFDGIGGFPLAGIYAGMKPIWASEIEPFPIRVTTKRMPFLKHLGDIHVLNGGEIEPVDVITFGSPCTDLSIAGKRSGIHGAQSSLFFEAVRVITEMRKKTNGTKPRWLVFENVPGVLSSSAGSDYRIVLESLVRVKDPDAVIPMPEKNKWLPAGEIMGDDYSLAWRILDAAKGWGVAQRRRRIFVVVDLDGQRAGQVLFESEGVSGYTPPRVEARKGAAGGAEAGAGTAGGDGRSVGFEPGALRREGGHAWEGITGTLRADMGDNQAAVAIELKPTDRRIRPREDGIDRTPSAPKAYGICSDRSNAMLSNNPHSGVYEADTSRTIDCSGGSPTCNQGGVAVVEPIAFCANQRDEVRDLGNVAGAISASPGMKQQTFVAAFMGGQGSKAGGLGFQEETSPTLKAAPSGSNIVPDVVYAIQGNMIGRKDENGPQGDGVNENVCFTLNTIDRPAVACPESRLGSGKQQTGTLTACGASHCAFLSNQEALSGDYCILEPTYSLDRASFNQGENAQFGISIACEQAQTLVSQGPSAVAQPHCDRVYLVRRLTPGECCRLQGYPDGWCEHLGTREPTDAELHWWASVFVDWRRAQGKAAKPPSRARLIKWLNEPRTDAAEYKAYGNSVAVPCVFFVLAGIAWAAGTEQSCITTGESSGAVSADGD